MCLPFMHKWKDHYRVFSEYGVRGDTVWHAVFQTRCEFRGRECRRCGKWEPTHPGNQPPRRGRVKRQTRTFRSPLTDAEKARQDALRNVWGSSSDLGGLSSFGVGDNYLNPLRSRSMPSDNPWLTPPTGGG